MIPIRHLLLAALLGTTPAMAAPVPPASPEALARELLESLRGKNNQLRLAVLHEKTRACINSQTRPYFDWIFTRQFRHVPPEQFKVTTQPLSQAPGPLPDQSTYPVAPTHQIQIDFNTGPYSNTSIVIFARQDAGAWREILPCPSAETIAGAQRSTAEREQQEQRIRLLAGKIPASLRTDILTLLKEGRRVDAIKKYASATGEELVIAKGVVEALGNAK